MNDKTATEKREIERDEAITRIRATLAALDALQPQMTEEELDQALREARSTDE